MSSFSSIYFSISALMRSLLRFLISFQSPSVYISMASVYVGYLNVISASHICTSFIHECLSQISLLFLSFPFLINITFFLSCHSRRLSVHQLLIFPASQPTSQQGRCKSDVGRFYQGLIVCLSVCHWRYQNNQSTELATSASKHDLLVCVCVCVTIRLHMYHSTFILRMYASINVMSYCRQRKDEIFTRNCAVRV